MAAQQELLAEQGGRLRDLEAAAAQLRERCGELKQAAGTAEARGAEAGAEVLKGNRIIEKLTVRSRFLITRAPSSRCAAAYFSRGPLGAALPCMHGDTGAIFPQCHHCLGQAGGCAARSTHAECSCLHKFRQMPALCTCWLCCIHAHHCELAGSAWGHSRLTQQDKSI